MKKIAKGKPKTAKRRDLSRADRAIRLHKEIAADKKRLPPKETKPPVPTPIAKMKKVSLFLRPQTIPKAHAKARKLNLSLTAYVAGLVEADLCRKAA